MNFRGHKLTQIKVQKSKKKSKKKKKTQRKSQHLRKSIIQVPQNNKKFRKTRSRLGQENPKKEVDVEPIAPNSEAESQTKYTIQEYHYRLKTKFEEEAIPPPLRSRGVFIVGFPPTTPSPLNTVEL